MALGTQLAVAGKLARQLVAALAALALVGATLGECQCPTRAAAEDPCACCCSTSGPSTGTTVRARMSNNDCGTTVGETAFGENLSKVDSTPAAGAVVHVALLHDEADRVAPFAEAMPLVRSSRHSILRI